MTSFHAVDTMVAAIRAKIAAASVLSITNENGVTVAPTILDRDEDPAVLADSPTGLPAICVVLIGDKPDSISPYISSYDWLHSFNVIIAGYYRALSPQTVGEDIYNDIGGLREKAYDCAELFKGNGAWFNPGVVKNLKLELGYYEMVDYVIYRFVITLSCDVWEL